MKLTGVRVRAWQGIPDITVDKAEQVELLSSAPWGSEIDLDNHVVDVELSDVVNSASRVGITTSGTVVSVREDSGIIMRCVTCRRVTRDGECSLPNCVGKVESQQDVRLRLVIDNGDVTASVLINKDASLGLMNTTESKMAKAIENEGQMEYVQSIRDYILGRELVVNGRTIVDDQGAMILADKAEISATDAAMLATEVRAQWGELMQPARSIKRQSALHMFASEYGESTLSEKGSGEFDPSFVVTKIGSRVNRVIVAGLLERIEGRDVANGSVIYQGN